MIKRIIAILTAFLIAISLVGCSPKDEASQGGDEIKRFVVSYDGDPGTCDIAETTGEYGLPLNIFDRLVESETIGTLESKIVPGLAKEWTISDDGLVYTFYLNQGVKFHNGEELKASDVAFTIDRMLNGSTNGMNSEVYDMIKGAKERLEGTADKVEGINIIDDYTIELTLYEPYAPFLAILATPGGSIYNQKNVEEAGIEFGIVPEKTMGTGPFQIVSWTVNDRIICKAFDDYFKGRAKIDELEFRLLKDPDTIRMLFEQGEIDVFDCDIARSQIPFFLESEKWKDNIISGPRVGVYYYAINQTIEPMNIPEVRKAVIMSINRQEMLDSLYYGRGTLVNGIMPPGLYGYNPDLPEIEYNPEKAKQMLAAAGYPDGFELDITQITDRPTSLKANEFVQSELAKVGIKVNINQIDQPTWLDTRRTGELPMYFSDWSADYNDPDNFIYPFFSESNTVGRSFNYANKDIQNKIELARVTVDPDERVKLYREIEKVIAQDDAAWIPFFALEHLFVVQPYVKNYKVAWNGWSNQSYYSIDIEK